MREALKYAAGLALTVVLLGLVLRGQDLRAVGQALGRASWSLLLAGAALNLAHNFFRVWRWGALLAPVRPSMPFRPMFSAVIIGYLTSWVVPGRLGELVRPALLAGREQVPLGPCIGSVLADRIADLGAIVMLLVLGAFLAPLEGQAVSYAAHVRLSALLLLLVTGGALVALVAASAFRPTLEVWFSKRGRFMHRVGRTILALSEGTSAFRRPHLLAVVAVMSLAAWIIIGLGTWAGIRAAGGRVGYPAVLVMLPMLAFGVSLPTPGGAGGYHAMMAFGLTTLFHVPAEIAISAGILMHLAITIPVILLGMVLLKTDHVHWHHLIEAAKQVRHLGADVKGVPGGLSRESEP